MQLKRHLPSLLALLVLALWTAAAYAPALSGPFFFDDEHFILRNEMVHSLDRIPAIYRSAVTQGASIKGNFYRPNQQLVYALLYHWVGATTSWPYHAVQIALHIGAGYALFFLLRALRLGPLAAAVGSLFFLLHPVQTEAVAYISGLADPLAACFGLTALALAAHWLWGERRGFTPARLALFAALMVLMLFTKEHGIVLGPLLLLLIAATAVAQRRWPRRDEIAAAALALSLSMLWVILKFTVFNFGSELGLSNEVNAYTQSLTLRLSTFVSVLWDYAVLIVWPQDLYYEKPYRAYADWLSLRSTFGFALIALALGLIANASRAPLVALAAAWFFAALLPFVGVVPLNAIFLEHWLYLPMAGLALGVALLFAAVCSHLNAKETRVRRLGYASALLVCLLSFTAGSLRVRARSAEWADIEAFYLAELKHTTDAGRIYNNLGMYYADQHDDAKAIDYYRKAALSPTGEVYAQPHHNLAVAYLKAGKSREAVEELHRALRIDPRFVYSLKLLHELFVYSRDQARLQSVDNALNTLKSGQMYDFSALEAQLFTP